MPGAASTLRWSTVAQARLKRTCAREPFLKLCSVSPANRASNQGRIRHDPNRVAVSAGAVRQRDIARPVHIDGRLRKRP